MIFYFKILIIVVDSFRRFRKNLLETNREELHLNIRLAFHSRIIILYILGHSQAHWKDVE